jgi:hypothetical protein
VWHHCVCTHLVVFNAWVNSDCLLKIHWCQYSSNLLPLLLPCIQEAEFMELEAMAGALCMKWGIRKESWCCCESWIYKINRAAA